MKIIIPVLHRFGDMILTTGMFRTLKNQFPNSEIYVIAAKDNSIILKGNPNIKKVYIFEKNPLSLIKLFFQLIIEKFDYLIDPKNHYSSESSFIARIINSKYKIGFNKTEKRIFNLDLNLSNADGIHFSELNIQSLDYLKIEEKNIYLFPELFTNSEANNRILEQLKETKYSKNILVNISAGKENRRFSFQKWNQLISFIDLNTNILINCEPRDNDLKDEIITKFPYIKYIQITKFDELISLVNLCDLIITPDTSVVHIASAFNKPIVSFYNGLRDFTAKFAPLSNKSLLIEANLNEEKIETIDLSVYKEKIHKFIIENINSKSM